MKKSEIVSPEFKKNGFNCPHCRAFTQQWWGWMGIYPHNKRTTWSHVANGSASCEGVGEHVHVAMCIRCGQFSLWISKNMVFPDVMAVDLPNEDFPDEIKADYMEAASVLQKSPRAAAALLRLALQKLCKHLGGKGKSIQGDIDLLVKTGLPESVLKAMDAVRIIGNEALHPGQIDMRDDTETAAMLFRLINFVAEKTLTDPKQVDAFYTPLPDSKKRNNRGKGE